MIDSSLFLSSALARGWDQSLLTCGGWHSGLKNFFTPERHKLETAHEIAADVRARHPEMQVKRREEQ